MPFKLSCMLGRYSRNRKNKVKLNLDLYFK